MNDSDKKDKILEFLNERENREETHYVGMLNDEVFKNNPLNESELSYLVECILRDGYATGNVQAFQYDASTTSFIDSGGYTGRDGRIKSEVEQETKRQKIIDQKTSYELRIAKWQVILFWIITPITVIGSILGIIAFFRK